MNQKVHGNVVALIPQIPPTGEHLEVEKVPGVVRTFQDEDKMILVMMEGKVLNPGKDSLFV